MYSLDRVMDTDLRTKYRPTKLEDVIGQGGLAKSLTKVIKDGTTKSFLLTGPSGAGKTTIARIIASMLNVPQHNVLEYDGATRGTVEEARGLVERVAYRSMGETGSRLVIMDECHAISKQAWQALLKTIEEPPRGTYWVFCTTEAHKVPKTIQTRCVHYELAPPRRDDIADLLEKIAKAEGFICSDAVITLIASKCGGSVRLALTNLAKCSGCKGPKAAAKLLREIDTDDEAVIDLCRLLLNGGNWQQAMSIVARLDEKTGPETVRHIVLAYMTKVAMGAKSDDRAGRTVEIMSAFSEPYPATNEPYPLIISLAQVLLA